MSRNVQQVLGEHLNHPARFIFCYTSDGVEDGMKTTHKTGGTGQAIRIGSSYGIKTHNLGNPATLGRALEWIKEVSEQVLATHGLDPRQLVSDFLASHQGIQQTVQADLISLALSGDIDVLINESSCQNDMAMINQRFADAFPCALEADQLTRKGDRKKLGTYTSGSFTAPNGRSVTIVNAYTQYRHRKESGLHTDYEAIRKSFRAIGKDFGQHSTLGFPRIGTGPANGCWVTISNIIRHELRNTKHLLINHDPSFAPAQAPSHRQGDLDFGI